METISLDLSPPKSEEGFLSVLPVSVIDIAKQGSRIGEDHSATSSRANYSPFPEEVARLCYELYLRDAKKIFDPFAGWGERHFYAKQYGKSYVGFDTSKEAIESAKNRFGVDNTLASSETTDIPMFDGMLTCPPYWNLEKYGSENGLDRTKSWDIFLKRYNAVLSRCFSSAVSGAKICIMVGDWRADHKYYDLEFETCAQFKWLGAKVVDKVVVSRKTVSKIKIMVPQAKRLGYTVKVHESLLVFEKA